MLRREFLASCAALLATGCNKSSPPPPITTTPDWVISNGVITVRASRRFGSAVYSILYKGVELLDSYDHGRLYQSAWQYDGLGEGYNPTEGGSAADSVGMGSSSEVIEAAANGDTFTAKSKLAMWQPHPDGGSWLEKTIRVGAGQPNLISDTRVISAAADHTAAVEIVTAYMTPAFSQAKTLEVASGAYADFPLNDHGGATTPNAIVACTPDGSCALGLWSPDPSVTMIGQRLAGITKLDIWGPINMKAGERYTFPCFAAVGTLAEAAAALRAAHFTS